MALTNGRVERVGTQLVELLGRNWLTGELLRAGLEVARPVRDIGIDLIAYADLSASVTQFTARPIQMKASSVMGFGLDRKYEKFANLILAYVWFLRDPRETVTYAMSYPEALRIATEMKWTATDSWARGSYVNTRPGARLRELLAPYLMTPERWWRTVVD